MLCAFYTSHKRQASAISCGHDTKLETYQKNFEKKEQLRMATKKRWKEEGREKGAPKRQAKKKAAKRDSSFRTFQQQPSTGAHKFLRPAWPFQKNDEDFK